MQSPSYIALMTYLDDAGIRQQVYHANSVRAASGKLDNREILAKILELRKEKARLLGFADFADLVIDDRMAHKGERAQEFLNSHNILLPRPLRSANWYWFEKHLRSSTVLQ